MATLIENTNRIVDALDDIKNAIIAKGVTPTGKCETFAAAISQISGGSGVKFSSGNYELTKGTTLKNITLDFKPQVLILNQRSNNTYTNASTRTFIYNESLSTTNYDSIVTTSVTKQNLGTTTVLQIYSIDNNGFTQRPHSSNNSYWTYFAIGGLDTNAITTLKE